MKHENEELHAIVNKVLKIKLLCSCVASAFKTFRLCSMQKIHVLKHVVAKMMIGENAI